MSAGEVVGFTERLAQGGGDNRRWLADVVVSNITEQCPQVGVGWRHNERAGRCVLVVRRVGSMVGESNLCPKHPVWGSFNDDSHRQSWLAPGGVESNEGHPIGVPHGCGVVVELATQMSDGVRSVVQSGGRFDRSDRIHGRRFR